VSQAVKYTQYAYDAVGWLWKVADAKRNNFIVKRYYGDGGVKEVEDAEGNVTRSAPREDQFV
jgi:hypothetical protein